MFISQVKGRQFSRHIVYNSFVPYHVDLVQPSDARIVRKSYRTTGFHMGVSLYKLLAKEGDDFGCSHQRRYVKRGFLSCSPARIRRTLTKIWRVSPVFLPGLGSMSRNPNRQSHNARANQPDPDPGGDWPDPWPWRDVPAADVHCRVPNGGDQGERDHRGTSRGAGEGRTGAGLVRSSSHGEEEHGVWSI